MRAGSSLVLIVAVLCRVAQSEESGECSLACSNDGECQTGQATISEQHTYPSGLPLPFFANASIDGAFCLCETDGFTGVTCEVPFQTCDTDRNCYHGGRCVFSEGLAGNRQSSCDCLDAAAQDGLQFVGDFCEIAVSDICSDGIHCFNGGMCADTLDGLPCICPDGFDGEHCGEERSSCTLGCRNGGVCELGDATIPEQHAYPNGQPLPFFTSTSMDGQHCNQCGNGFTGVTCEVPFQSCTADLNCYNGGRCLFLEGLPGNVQASCDCFEAVQEDSDLKFIGEFCELAVTALCSLDGQVFCTNGGVCTDSPDGLTCSCPAGFEGENCESQSVQTPTCALECSNGGICQAGQATISEEHTYPNGLPLPFFTSTSIGGEFCLCESGFTGVTCEVPFHSCDSDRNCYNGGDCLFLEGLPGSVQSSCDCFQATQQNGFKFLGDFCEIGVTALCSLDGQAFCANNGVCTDSPSGLGCTCPPGFVGEHCESLFVESLPPSVAPNVPPTLTPNLPAIEPTGGPGEFPICNLCGLGNEMTMPENGIGMIDGAETCGELDEQGFAGTVSPDDCLSIPRETPVSTVCGCEPVRTFAYFAVFPPFILLAILFPLSSDGHSTLLSIGTPQNDAVVWLASSPNFFQFSRDQWIQRFVLATVFFATGGPDWVDGDNWLMDDESECDWIGVTCNDEGAVISLELKSFNLEGALPFEELSWLPGSLQLLDATDNGLTGSIPASVGLLTSLVELRLANNLLSGSIPSELCQLDLLDTFEVHANEDITGSVPDCLSDLSSVFVNCSVFCGFCTFCF